MFHEEILKLINLHHEGSYWDFKKQWYSDKCDLLHDIICMANNLENRDAYIIVGIDEENNFRFIDVSKDSNRKNTQMLVDFLKDKKFAGGTRPSVHVEILDYGDATIDVIVVENSYNTPFYLAERFQQIQANSIYTRIQDTNTPKDKCADINNVEYLWKKRFHMIDTPIEKFRYYLLDKDNWSQSSSEDHLYYNLYPEYSIDFEQDERDGYEYYFFNQCNHNPHWGIIQLKYMSTSLLEFSGIGLDGFNYFTIAPEFGYFHLDGYHLNENTIYFKYFVKGSLPYIIHNFYYRSPYNDKYAHDRFIESILIFDSKMEFEHFKYYAEQNWLTFKYDKSADIKPYLHEIEGLKMEFFDKEWDNFFKLKHMLQTFRNENQL